jgi:protein tyrosine phosphatase (PTP) superfamily phosphohydrolase (DUF442 family)
MRTALIASLLLVLVACGESSTPEPSPDRARLSEPIAKEADAYKLATALELPETAAIEHSDVRNIFRLGSRIISGSEPHGEAALRRIADLGVKTILSVDGKVPDAETAEKLGMRYVHVPIQYSGISASERLRIAKVFRELEGPFYVHCFHGKHRGPAAAAWGRVVLDGVSREQALAEMRQWCGTSKKYQGLYGTIGKSKVPTVYETESLEWSFPSAHQFEGFRGAMVEISRTWDNLVLLSKIGWKPDPEHPDLDALNEARKLSQAFSASAKLLESEERPEDFRRLTTESVEHARDLLDGLERLKSGDVEASAAAMKSFRAVDERCDSCHREYRNQ